MYNKKLIAQIGKLNFRFPIKKISEDLNYSKGTISTYLNGKVQASENFIKLFANFYNVDEDLLTESHLNIAKKSGAQIVEDEESYKIALDAGLKMLPEVNFTFSGGITCLTEDTERIQKWWYLPDCEDCDGVAPMQGTSMMPTFPPGCKLILKKYSFDISNPNTIAFGNVFGIVLEDPFSGQYHGHIKILRRYNDIELSKKYWIAHSVNSEEYDDFDIEINQVRGLWVVKQHIITNVLL